PAAEVGDQGVHEAPERGGISGGSRWDVERPGGWRVHRDQHAHPALTRRVDEAVERAEDEFAGLGLQLAPLTLDAHPPAAGLAHAVEVRLVGDVVRFVAPPEDVEGAADRVVVERLRTDGGGGTGLARL